MPQTGLDLYTTLALTGGDFAAGQRTKPKQAVFPHGNFARGLGDPDSFWDTVATPSTLNFVRDDD